MRMPTRLVTVLVALLGGLAIATATSGAAAAAPRPAARTKSCKSVSGRAGGVDQIRVTKSFSCREVRLSIGGWLNLFQQSGPRPWTCASRGASAMQWRCHLRTSFGGSRPLRLYRLTFRLLDA